MARPPRRPPAPPVPYPAYARSERIADGVVHAVGVAFALLGAAALLRAALQDAPAGRGAALAVYGLALLATFLASACYHMTPWERLRPALRRVDHAAIYLKIAGTSSPLAALVGTPFAWGVLALLWVMALAGASAKLLWWHEPGRLGLWSYLAMGWMGVLLMVPLAATLPAPALALAFLGGLLYTAGTAFFLWESLRFSTAIWHVFVLLASGCFFAAIAMGALPGA